MNISQLIEKLNKVKEDHGDLDVLYTDPNSHYGPFSVNGVDVQVAEKDEYPDDFDMPEGYTFIELNNWD